MCEIQNKCIVYGICETDNKKRQSVEALPLLLLIGHLLCLFRAYFSDNLVGLFVIVDID